MQDDETIDEDAMIEIKRPEDIPTHFENEDEEADFWSTHYFGQAYWDTVGPLPRERLPAYRRRQKAETRPSI